MTDRTNLEIAIDAARLAAACLSKYSGSSRTVLSRQHRDIKLQADKDSERIVLETLGARSPYPILSEERGGAYVLDAAQPLWLVDPLDGTYNYSQECPLYCVSIALWKGTEPLVGVVYDFVHDELFAAAQGQGATLNGRPIAVSNVAAAADACLSTGLAVARDYSVEALSASLEQMRRFRKLRMIGSAALSLAYVACGRFDAYAEESIRLWDVAAGLALVCESGGWFDCSAPDAQSYALNVRAAGNQLIFQGT